MSSGPYKELVTIIEEANRIYNSELSWKDKYSMIFKNVPTKLKELGVEIDWYDPDMDYEDDIRAYMNALNEIVKKREEPMEMPVCPICKKEMWVEEYTGYYETFEYWQCDCGGCGLPKAKTEYRGDYA